MMHTHRQFLGFHSAALWVLVLIASSLVFFGCPDDSGDTNTGGTDTGSENTPPDGTDEIPPLPGGSFDATFTSEKDGVTIASAQASGGAVFGIATDLFEGTKTGNDGEGFVIYMRNQKDMFWETGYFASLIGFEESERLSEGTYDIYSVTTAEFNGFWGDFSIRFQGDAFHGDIETGTFTISESTPDQIQGTFAFQTEFNGSTEGPIEYKTEGSFTAIHVDDVDTWLQPSLVPR